MVQVLPQGKPIYNSLLPRLSSVPLLTKPHCSVGPWTHLSATRPFSPTPPSFNPLTRAHAPSPVVAFLASPLSLPSDQPDLGASPHLSLSLSARCRLDPASTAEAAPGGGRRQLGSSESEHGGGLSPRSPRRGGDSGISVILGHLKVACIPVTKPGMADASSRTDTSTVLDTDDKNQMVDGQSGAIVPSNSSDRSDRSDKPMDQKVLRRLAQNREAARKSRLRKKAYVQQLESSKLKLASLEQEINKARQQGIYISSSGDQTHAMSGNGAMTFDLEYARWLEEQNKQINELRTALLVNQLEPLTEQQLLGLSNLQQSSQQAEDALSQGMEALQQSLADTLAGSLGPSGSSGNVANYMGQMAMAMGKLGTLENFLRQADNLRQQTLHQMQRILTIRQAARALLAIHDYFSRLRALSSLWLARPRE
uniref:BZIP domain-containing protein n=1 Tax=Oryza glumipatula TaxID=40148 RepID=A0A0D9Z6G8_9ORYZ